METLPKQTGLILDGLVGRTLRQLQSGWRSVIIVIPFVWLLIFFLAPFFIVAKISLAELTIASPPFSKMIEWTDGTIMTIRVVFDNFAYISSVESH